MTISLLFISSNKLATFEMRFRLILLSYYGLYFSNSCQTNIEC